MDLIKAPTKIEHPIYRAEFRYIPPSVMKKKSESEDLEIQKRLTGNIMEVGQPEHWNLKELCKRKGIELPAEIEMSCEKFDFWLIQSVFSFMPSPNNQFNWARIVAKLEPLSKDNINPITYDAYPRNIYREKKEKHRVNIGLSFKFAEIIEPKVEIVKEIEFKILKPIISVAGIGKSTPTWDFSDKAVFNLKDVNALYIILKTPCGSEGIKVSYFSYSKISNRLLLKIIPTTAKKIKGKETYEIKF